jgi:hypothetical protein
MATPTALRTAKLLGIKEVGKVKAAPRKTESPPPVRSRDENDLYDFLAESERIVHGHTEVAQRGGVHRASPASRHDPVAESWRLGAQLRTFMADHPDWAHLDVWRDQEKALARHPFAPRSPPAVELDNSRTLRETARIAESARLGSPPDRRASAAFARKATASLGGEDEVAARYRHALRDIYDDGDGRGASPPWKPWRPAASPAPTPPPWVPPPAPPPAAAHATPAREPTTFWLAPSRSSPTLAEATPWRPGAASHYPPSAASLPASRAGSRPVSRAPSRASLAPPSEAGSAASSLWTELPTWTDAPPASAANPRGRFFAQLDRFEDFQRGRPDLAAGVPVQAPRRPWRPSSPRPNGSARMAHRDGAGKREGFLRC